VLKLSRQVSDLCDSAWQLVHLVALAGWLRALRRFTFWFLALRFLPHYFRPPGFGPFGLQQRGRSHVPHFTAEAWSFAVQFRGGAYG